MVRLSAFASLALAVACQTDDVVAPIAGQHAARAEVVALPACDGTPLRAPLGGALVATSGFFLRRPDPNLEPTDVHLGLDLRATIGTPVFAAASGWVTKADWAASSKDPSRQPRGGLIVSVQHNSRETTKYMHLSAVATTVGSFVRAGELIGFSGNTNGNVHNQKPTVIPHLHFERLVDGVDEDPMPCLDYREEIRVSPDPLRVSLNGTAQLKGQVYSPAGEAIAGRSYFYRSMDTAVAIVDARGVVTGLKRGVTQIEISASLNTRTLVDVIVGVPQLISASYVISCANCYTSPESGGIASDLTVTINYSGVIEPGGYIEDHTVHQDWSGTGLLPIAAANITSSSTLTMGIGIWFGGPDYPSPGMYKYFTYVGPDGARSNTITMFVARGPMQ